MKKARIVLFSISLLAVCSAAFGFRVLKRNGNLFCSTTKAFVCTLRARTTVIPNGIIQYCTTVANDPCTIPYRIIGSQ